MDTDIVIVGAGAAGLATAIFARRAAPSRGVVLLDGARRPGAKILVSGGSRCNVTNRAVADTDFWGGRRPIIRRVLRAFSAAQTVAFFAGLGVPLHEEADGKLFPDTNRSRDVLDALVREVTASGAELRPDHRVVSVEREAARFRIVTTRGTFLASRIVLATGGRSLPKSGSDGAGYLFAERLGHSIVATTPGLVPLIVRGDEEAGPPFPSGVAHDAELTVWVGGRAGVRLRGSLLWTHFGISGPAALDASRHWLRAAVERHEAALTVSFLPGETFDALDRRWRDAAARRPKRSIESLLAADVPASLAAVLLARLAIEPACELAHLARDDRRRLANAILRWPLRVTGSRGYNYAEVTAGGVALEEIDPSTLESRRCPGLYLVGEILDVDGRLGGFNFQWAWSSAYVAGRALASEHVGAR